MTRGHASDQPREYASNSKSNSSSQQHQKNRKKKIVRCGYKPSVHPQGSSRPVDSISNALDWGQPRSHLADGGMRAVAGFRLIGAEQQRCLSIRAPPYCTSSHTAELFPFGGDASPLNIEHPSCTRLQATRIMPRKGAIQWAAPRGRMHRAFKGLYANRMIQFGNSVSFAENKSRRTWKPNVQISSVYSEALGRRLKFRMTTHARRCIKKAGGIDNYLVNTRNSEIKYPKAIELKEQIIRTRAGKLQPTTSSPTDGSVSAPASVTLTAQSNSRPLSASNSLQFRYVGLGCGLEPDKVTSQHLIYTREISS